MDQNINLWLFWQIFWTGISLPATATKNGEPRIDRYPVRDHVDNNSLTYWEYRSASQIRRQSCSRSRSGVSARSGGKRFVSARRAQKKWYTFNEQHGNHLNFQFGTQKQRRRVSLASEFVRHFSSPICFWCCCLCLLPSLDSPHFTWAISDRDSSSSRYRTKV